MSGYIYTMYAGADPGYGWTMNDPVVGNTPTLGACVPNIRRHVKVGEWLFAISGRVKDAAQFVVCGFKVKEKIDQLAAYNRFPEYRLSRSSSGQLLGNVIVNADGTQHPDDNHSNFERRVEDYIVGGDAIVLQTGAEMDRGRTETIPTLRRVFGKDGNRVFDIIGRGRKLTDLQSNELREWLESLKR
jgi:hypothetical protein